MSEKSGRGSDLAMRAPSGALIAQYGARVRLNVYIEVAGGHRIRAARAFSSGSGRSFTGPVQEHPGFVHYR